MQDQLSAFDVSAGPPKGKRDDDYVVSNFHSVCSDLDKMKGLLCRDLAEIGSVDAGDGFIDWKEFGKHIIESDAIVQTEYSSIRRISNPAPKQAMDIQTMRSSFL